MTPAEREKAIIKHIQSHPSCNVEDVVRGVHGDVSRVTVFKILHKLIENGAVKNYSENNQKRNARDHRLYVDEGNPLVSVRFELDEFESTFFDLFNKEKIEWEQLFKLAEKSAEEKEATFAVMLRYGQVIQAMWSIFNSMIDACLFRFLFIWSQKISDWQVLQQLQSMVFSKIADILTRISESLKSMPLGNLVNDTNLMMIMFQRFRGFDLSGPLEQHLDSFKRLGKEEEVKPVIGSLWKMFGEIKPYVYPEPRNHGWPFNYDKDDWSKLVSLLRKHRKSIRYSKDRSGSSTAA